MEDLTTSKTLPNDASAERFVIGSMIIDKNAAEKALPELKQEDFYFSNHQIIFEALLELNNSSEDINLVSVKEHLKKTGSLEKIGGIRFLLSSTESIISTSNIKSHIKILKEKSLRRSLIKKSILLTQTSYDEASENDQLLSIVDDLSKIEISQTKRQKYFTMPELTEDCRISTEKILDSKDDSVIKTGFVDLDGITCGLSAPDMFILAGRPSMGKSSLAAQIAMNVSEHGGNVIMFTLETSREQVVLKMALQRSRISFSNLRSGNFSDQDMLRFVDSLGYLAELPIYINDDSDINVENMKNIAKLIEIKHGKISLIEIDYLQLIESKKRHDNRNQEVSHISRNIRKLGKYFGCPILLLSQLSRDVERRGDRRPIMSDLRESGAIEQDADIIAFVYRDEVYDPDSESKGIAEVIIRKQRNGPLGTVRLAFFGKYMRFENLAR